MLRTTDPHILKFAETVGAHHVARSVSAWMNRMNLPVPAANGIWYRMPEKTDDRIYHDMVRGRHEVAELSLLRAHFRHSHTVIDLGAYNGFIGSHALLEKITSGGSIVCVEANPDCHAALQENMKAAQRRDTSKDVTIVKAALVDHANGRVPFARMNDLGSHVINGFVPAVQSSLITVDTVTLDRLVKDHVRDSYSLLCDIEGGEKALFGSKALSLCRQMIIELHEDHLAHDGYSMGDAVKEFEKMGFELKGKAHNSFAFVRS